jgi:glycosyltransferase involved in cell wall biosynthesis
MIRRPETSVAEARWIPPALPSVSVVVPTFKRAGTLRDVLRPLLDDDRTSELIVVVDGCTDGSLELLMAWADHEPRLVVVWQQNLGANAARQAGVRRAGGDIVLFIDDDVVAEPGLVSGHASIHARIPHAVVAGYMPVQAPTRRGPGQFGVFLYADSYERMCSAYEADASAVLRNLWFGNVSLRREAVTRIGLVAPGAPVYHEDKEFGFRCALAGLTPVFDRGLLARHRFQSSPAAFVRDVVQQAESRRVLTQKYGEVAARADAVWKPPRMVRHLLRPAATPLLSSATVTPLLAVVRLAGHLHAWPVETAAARALRQVLLYVPQQASKSRNDRATTVEARSDRAKDCPAPDLPNRGTGTQPSPGSPR